MIALFHTPIHPHIPKSDLESQMFLESNIVCGEVIAESGVN